MIIANKEENLFFMECIYNVTATQNYRCKIQDYKTGMLRRIQIINLSGCLSRNKMPR
jgi:hypothetical protein